MNIRIPAPGETAVQVTVDSGAGGEVEKRRQLLVESRTGQVLRESGFADNGLGQRLRALARFLHTGEEGGLTGQCMAAIASAGGALLVWTVLALALRRLRKARNPGPGSRDSGGRPRESTESYSETVAR